ncbi:hypothetical protein [Luteimonas abyssi]|uniref:hypothetical protein n=1 Tax=Luteimonas abyssi TaxID=1247514 RepID=UPI0012F7C504|nr:hypothetical protein [Luteimonas abyssi]
MSFNNRIHRIERQLNEIHSINTITLGELLPNADLTDEQEQQKGFKSNLVDDWVAAVMECDNNAG